MKRVGAKAENKTRPMIATLSSRENLLTLLKKAKELKKTDDFHNVYIGPDRTFEERELRRKTLESLKRLTPCDLRVVFSSGERARETRKHSKHHE